MSESRKLRWFTRFLPKPVHGFQRPAVDRRRRIAVPEQLEARMLLTGGFTNAPIGDAEMATLLDGLDGFANFGRELSATGEFAEPLGLLTNPDGSPMSIGGLLNIGDVLNEKLAGPVRTFLEGPPAVMRDTDDLTDFLALLPGVTSVRGGLATIPADELRFELTFQDSAMVSAFGIDFGPAGDEMGIATTGTTTAFADIEFETHFSWGMDTTRELNAEQAFFLRDTSLSVSVSLHGLGTPFGVSVGFIDSPVTNATFFYDAGLNVSLNDLVPGDHGSVTLSELNGNSVDELANVTVAVDRSLASFTLRPVLGTWTPLVPPRITVASRAIGVDPALTVNASFGELLNFNNVDADRLITGLEFFGSWLDGFADSSVLDVDVPFARGATLGNTIVASDEYLARIANLRDADGQPRFDSAQAFAALPDVDIDYNPITNRLVFPMTLTFAPHQDTAPLMLGDSSQSANERCVFPLCGLTTDSLATLTSASVIEFDLGIDLTTPEPPAPPPPGEDPPTEEELLRERLKQQFSVDNLVVRGGVFQNATDLVGSAMFGIVGIDFADGRYLGASSFRADIVNPTGGGSRATLGELLDGLGDPDSLLGVPLEKIGSTILRLDDVTLQPGLLSSLGGPLSLPAGASLTARVADFAQPDVTSLVETGIGLLGNFSNLSLDFLVDSIVAGLTSTVRWGESGLDALVSVGLDMADFVQTRVIDVAADTVQRGLDAFEAATGAAARLQDLNEIFADYVAPRVADVVDLATTFATELIVNATTATVEIGLTLETGTSDRSLDLGLNFESLSHVPGGEPLQVAGVGNSPGLFDSIEASASVRLDVDFEIDLSVPAMPQVFVQTDSALTASVHVDAPAGGQTLHAEASLGPIGITLDAGSFVIAEALALPGRDNPATFTIGLDDSPPGGRVSLGDLGSAALEQSATGKLDFNFSVQVEPNVTSGTDRFHFRISDLGDLGSIRFPAGDPLPDFPSIIGGINLPTNVAGLPAGLHDLLGGIGDAIDTGIFQLGFPLVGDALVSVANFISDLRAKIDAALDSLTSFACDTIEQKIEDALGLSGQPGDDVVQDCTVQNDIRFTLDIHDVPITKTISVHSDFGLPALGASIDADLELNVSYDVMLTFGLSLANGPYIDTANDVIRADVTLTMHENTDPMGMDLPEFSGTLGFIQVEFEKVSPDTVLQLTFNVDLNDPNANDDRLTVPELVGLARNPSSLFHTTTTNVMGSVELEFRATAEIVSFQPSIEVDLTIGWEFDRFDLRGSKPEVTLTASLDVGSFFSQVVLPVIDPLQDFLGTKPGKIGLDDVLDVLTDPLPIISDLIEKPTSITDIARAVMSNDTLPNAIDAFGLVVDAVASLVGAIGTFADAHGGGDAVILELGRLEFGTPGTRNFDATDPNLQFDLNQQIFGKPTPTELFDQFESLAGNITTVTNGINRNDAEIDFPFMHDPLSVFQFLLGFGEADLITFKFPSLQGSLPFEILVPIFADILKAGVTGSIDLSAELAIGYDTAGFREFSRTHDLKSLAEGFFISDTANADGTGPDVPEFSIGGDLLATVALDAVVVEAGVGGGVFAEIDADFIDRNRDGKIRGSELVPDQGCLKLTGTVGVKLEAFVKLLGFIRKEFPFARAELGSFHTTIKCPDLFGSESGNETGDRLAHLENGVLTLFVGDMGVQRTVKPYETNEAFFVNRSGDILMVQAFGIFQQFAAAQVDKIVADAGDGDDVIVLDNSVQKRTDIRGGDGADVIITRIGDDTVDGGPGDDSIESGLGQDIVTGGDGNDTIKGGNENSGGDVIDGGPGNDSIDGGDGNDTIDGGSGNDQIAGAGETDSITANDGDDTVCGGSIEVNANGAQPDTVCGGDATDLGDTIEGGLGDDVLFGGAGGDLISGDAGEDFIFGADGEDTIFGGGQRDVLNGGADNDTISGDDGRDVLLGDDGDDDMSGGDDGDLLQGGPGMDTISGGDGDDAIYGDDGSDNLFGDAGDNYIEGGSQNDVIEGDSGVDTIHGSEGDDIISGKGGDDFLFGESGDDVIDGAGGDDSIVGGPGGDEIDGGGGEDTIEGGAGFDVIRGGTGSDTIHGNEDNDIISGGPDPDLLFGDSGGDFIRGDNGSPVGSDGSCTPASNVDRDTIYGGTGGDAITGDCGDDLIYGEQGDDQDIHGNDGNDTIFGGANADHIFGDFGFDTIEGDSEDDELHGGDQDDTIRGENGSDTIFGDGGADSLFGDAGDDTIEGGANADVIDGGADNDHLSGQGGGDEIYGHVGNDLIEGNDGPDTIRGNAGDDHIEGDEGTDDLTGGPDNDTIGGGSENDTILGEAGEDLIFGDGDADDISGGPDNDTIRGGDDNDTAHGDSGNDLVIGNSGDDELFGDDGDDVLYGDLGNDTLTGGTDDDRAFGELGNDSLIGDDGDDILEGGDGNDTASGGAGLDAIYGDGGVDSLSGGDDADFIKAGDGIGDVLNGDAGNDRIVGSDDGSDDPKPLDTIPFGDLIDGGDGNDLIESLSGSDTVNAGPGDDTVTGGTHIDQIDGGSGTNVISQSAPSPAFAVSTGPDVGGHWGELNGSATHGGLTQVGGFEETTFATDTRVYVAWVDWRNGNSEIYLAYHDEGGSTWQELTGIASGSASGGGISADAEQSRRPTVVEIEVGVDLQGKPVTDLLVAWTKIDSSGNNTIEVRRRNGNAWTPLANPAQTGKADNARLVPFNAGNSPPNATALLGWIDSSSGTHTVLVAQYINLAGCLVGFPTQGGAGSFLFSQATRPMLDVASFDLTTVKTRTALIASYGVDGDHDIDVSLADAGPPLTKATLCPGAMGNFSVETPGGFGLATTFTDGDEVDPAVGMRLTSVLGQNEIETDVYVAWQQTDDRQDQVIAKVGHWPENQGPQIWEDLVPRYFGQAARVNVTSVSDTIGYAAKPDIATSNSYVFLAWMDDGVHSSGDGLSHIFVLTARGESRVLEERLRHDASGIGISETGGSVESLSITTEPTGIDSGSPYVVWTDHNATAPSGGLAGPGATQVLLRHDLDVPQFFVLVQKTGGSNMVTEGGSTDTYSIVLMSQPSSNVRIDLNPSAQITLSAAQIIFTPANWFTPQVVTITAVNDTKVEGTHTGTIAYSVASFDPDYNAITVFPDVCVIRDNDFGITDFTPNFRVVGRRRTISSIVLATAGVTDPSVIRQQNFHLTQPTARGPGREVPLRSVTFDTMTEMATITPTIDLALNKIYQLIVGGLASPNGPVSSQPFTFLVSATLTLVDRDGDSATLTLGGSPGFGYFKTLGSKSEISIETIEYRTTISGSGTGITLSGTARRGRSGNGTVTPPAAQTLSVAPGTTFRSTLTNPPVRIGPLPQNVIDELLAASGGTLAGVLV